MGLSGMPDVTALADLADDADSGVRLAALVALRRRQSSAVTRFLADADPLVLLEAARAIHDEPIAAAMPELAARLGRVESRDPQLLRRLVNANFRVGDRAAVGRLVALASDPAAAAPARADALRAMTTFADPSGRDRVVNLWRPLPKRDKTALGALLLPHLPALLATATDPVRLAAVELVDSWKLRQFDAALAALVASEDRSAAVRTAALATLDRFAVNDLGSHAKRGARSRVKQLRQLGVRILARLDPESAVPVLDELARTASIAERQNAITTLGTLRTAKADAVLDRWLDRVVRGDGLAKLQLEVLEAAGKREPEALLTKLGAYRAARDRAAAADIVENHVECLEGGDRGRGRGVFWSGDAAISCQKCHRIGERGGDAGPNLEGVGSRLSRRELLAALLDPSRVIAPGFGTVVFTRRDASEVVGVIKSETATHVTVVDAAGDEQRLARQDIAERSDPVSAMPPLRGLLTKRQLRDLVEFLARPDKDTKDRRRGAGEDQTRRPNLDSSDKEPAAASEDTSKGDGKDNSLGDGKDTDQGDGKDTSQGDGKDNSLGDGKDTGKGDGKDTRAGNARNDGE
jgi:quinoprotein glucose dehydrogenase